MKVASLLSLIALLACVPGIVAAQERPGRLAPPARASLPPPSPGPLRILLVDDDHSDNNHAPSDSRQSFSDRIFRKLVSDAVGGDAAAWEIATARTYANGPEFERLRGFPLIVWYTGANYGGNPDNTAVLSIEDEKTVRRYLEQVGGAVILVSPGYLSKVLGAGGTWEKADWPFVSEVLGVRGGVGLAQRFLPGTVNASGGALFNVGKGGAVETQFSLLNPAGASMLFTTTPTAAKSGSAPTPVATVHPYGRGRMIYVGFTFENLAEPDLAPAFNHLLSATGLVTPTLSANVRPAARPKAPPASAVSSPEAEPATVQVSGTPVSAVVSWTLQTATVQNARLGGSQQIAASASKPSATPYTPTVMVERLAPNTAPVRLTIASPDALKADDPGPLAPGGAVTYRVTLTDTQGRTGIKEASFTPPAPRDPPSLSASVQPDGSVVLTWPEVPGVATYQVTGTALDAPVTVRRATEWRTPARAPGPQQWKVASVYEPGGVLTASSAWASAATRVVPAPGKPFLALPNGAGSHAASEAHYRTRCSDALMPGSLCTAAGFIRDATNWEAGWIYTRGDRSSTHGGAAPQWPFATFDNDVDLGAARRVNCAPRKNGSTVCWTVSHDSTAPLAVTEPSSGLSGYSSSVEVPHRGMPKSLNVIIMADDKAFFGSWEFEGAQLPREPLGFSLEWWDGNPMDIEHSYANHASLRSGAVLDSQGRKGVPHACLSCHGGTYNPVTKQVTGASLLPVVPGRLRFPPGNWTGNRRTSEESIRRINEIILQSNPAPGIVDQIHAMYGGAVSAPNKTANDAAVPAGWTQQAGLYRQVIAPYCASCHFAQRGPMNFRSWGNLLQNKDAVQRTVCREFTMPHSEILFRKFWTEGGAVSLPGMLSSALGFPKCPQ
jgi:hypothetical protein